eukprot:scaffold9405_cov111-Cylindrotheca_fusiformis.AAC.2
MAQIDDDAFALCHSLRKVIVCSGSKKRGKGVFRNCQGLISAGLPEGLQVIEQLLFSDCGSLTAVKIPSSVVRIDDSAFWGYRSLTAVDLPHGLLEIGKWYFLECYSLETLQIPPTISKIGAFAFSNAHPCHTQDPPSVETIVAHAFIGERSLNSIELPKGILVDNSQPPTEQERFLVWLIYCPSLVNLAIPRLPEDDKITAGLLHNKSRLGSVMDYADDETRKLKH